MADLPKGPSGVQELIGRLRDDGVKAGRAEAERIEQEARAQADEIVARARAEAEALKKTALAQIETERAAAQDAIRMAFRDTRLQLAAELKAGFSAHVKKLVSGELHDREFLRRVLLAIFGKAVEGVREGQPIEVLLPEEVFVSGDSPTGLSPAGREKLRSLVLGISGDMLREGITLKPAGARDEGIRVKLTGKDIEIDLSDEAVAKLIINYLLPRYREIVREGK